MLTSVLELSLNLKNCIRICERSEQILMHFFDFKVDSNTGVNIVFYTLLPPYPLPVLPQSSPVLPQSSPVPSQSSFVPFPAYTVPSLSSPVRPYPAPVLPQSSLVPS